MYLAPGRILLDSDIRKMKMIKWMQFVQGGRDNILRRASCGRALERRTQDSSPLVWEQFRYISFYSLDIYLSTVQIHIFLQFRYISFYSLDIYLSTSTVQIHIFLQFRYIYMFTVQLYKFLYIYFFQLKKILTGKKIPTTFKHISLYTPTCLH